MTTSITDAHSTVERNCVQQMNRGSQRKFILSYRQKRFLERKPTPGNLFWQARCDDDRGSQQKISHDFPPSSKSGNEISPGKNEFTLSIRSLFCFGRCSQPCALDVCTLLLPQQSEEVAQQLTQLMFRQQAAIVCKKDCTNSQKLSAATPKTG